MAAALRVGAPLGASRRAPAPPSTDATHAAAGCRPAPRRNTASLAAAASPAVLRGISVNAAPRRATRSRAPRLRCAAAAQPLAELAAQIPLSFPGVSTLQQDGAAALLAAAGALLVIKTCDFLAQEGLLDRVRAAGRLGFFAAGAPLRERIRAAACSLRAKATRFASASTDCCATDAHAQAGAHHQRHRLPHDLAAVQARRAGIPEVRLRLMHSVSTSDSSLACSDSLEARYIAACVPLANGVRLAAIGTGVLRNDAAVKAISREGDPKCVRACAPHTCAC
jgi:hypothetical protein